MSTLTVVTDHPYYAPGSLVTGHVIAELRKPKKARSLLVDVKGYAKTEFYRSRGDHQGEISYFDYQLTVWTAPSHGIKMIETGKHTFGFQFRLPENLPPSFEREIGNIRYRIKAELDVPWGFNPEAEIELKVLSTEMTAINKPISEYVSLKCGLSFEVTLPKNVFGSGEKIPITLNIRNPNKKDISSVEVAVKSYIYYTGKCDFHGEESEEEEIISLKQKEPCKISSDQHTFNTMLHLTSTMPTISNCPIIQVENFLYVALHRPGIFATKLTAEIPITVVNVSLQDVMATKSGISKNIKATHEADTSLKHITVSTHN